jgi:signal transduction histidine kinase
MRAFFNLVLRKINQHAEDAVNPYVIFGIFGVVTYPLYYVFWAYLYPTGYENLWMRLIVVVLCFFLILKPYWPKKYYQFLPLYWYLTLLYSLPFLFTFLLLKNNFSNSWVLNSMTVLVLSILLMDTTALLIVLSSGVILGCIFYYLTNGSIHLPENFVSIAIYYISILIFGFLFARSKEFLQQAKLKAISMVSAGIAHDIRSPLASLLMIIKSCNEIPETERVALREAAVSIGDIANNLLSKYRTKESEFYTRAENRQLILLSALLLQTITDKKFQYGNLPIKFEYDFNQKGQFSFIDIEPSSFKRMISNLINNAVDSFDGNEGTITIGLDATNNRVQLTISDNGKGMPPEVVAKIMHKVSVTYGKSEGHGIGLAQVRDALEKSEGFLFIQSRVGEGTQITLQFQRVKSPDWIAEEIRLGTNDIVVILDDDASIHVAWDSRFELILQQAPNIQVHHFELCQKALNFINELAKENIKRIFLLTDFELLRQELNGLHVIEKANIKRSILVTSHYTNMIVLERAVKMGTKILPKQLASEVPIIFEDITVHENEPKQEEGLKTVDLVLVDDNENFAQTLIDFTFDEDVVDYYRDPRKFLENLNQYPKNTRICLDNNYTMVDTLGIEIVKDLHEQGYTRLYLLSGDEFKPGDIPSYLTVIPKMKADQLKDW